METFRAPPGPYRARAQLGPLDPAQVVGRARLLLA